MDSMCWFAWIHQCTEISILYMLHYDVVQHVLAWIRRDASMQFKQVHMVLHFEVIENRWLLESHGLYLSIQTKDS